MLTVYMAIIKVGHSAYCQVQVKCALPSVAGVTMYRIFDHVMNGCINCLVVTDCRRVNVTSLVESALCVYCVSSATN